jgi:hypothetical protein
LAPKRNEKIPLTASPSRVVFNEKREKRDASQVTISPLQISAFHGMA